MLTKEIELKLKKQGIEMGQERLKKVYEVGVGKFINELTGKDKENSRN